MARYEGQTEAAPHPSEDPLGSPDAETSRSVPVQPPRGEAAVHLADNGHVVLVLPPGEVVNGVMALAAAEKIERLAGAHKLPLLLILSGVESITRSARDVFSAARSLSAAAVIGVTPVDRVIANFLLGGDIQPCPTRYFSREADALRWLKRFAA